MEKKTLFINKYRDTAKYEEVTGYQRYPVTLKSRRSKVAALKRRARKSRRSNVGAQLSRAQKSCAKKSALKSRRSNVAALNCRARKSRRSTVGAQVSCAQKSALNCPRSIVARSKVGAQKLPRSNVARSKVGAQMSALNCPALKSRVTTIYMLSRMLKNNLWSKVCTKFIMISILLKYYNNETKIIPYVYQIQIVSISLIE